MKKVLLVLTALILGTLSLSADDVKTITMDNQRTDDKFKVGIVLGYPTGLTAGWRLSETIELNFVAATHYSDFTLGFVPLFTIANLSIADEIFPLSIGPAAYLGLDWNGDLNMDILGNVRIEYSFKEIPLNLFLEGGIGINLDFNGDNLVHPQGSGALGIRYIF